MGRFILVCAAHEAQPNPPARPGCLPRFLLRGAGYTMDDGRSLLSVETSQQQAEPPAAQVGRDIARAYRPLKPLGERLHDLRTARSRGEFHVQQRHGELCGMLSGPLYFLFQTRQEVMAVAQTGLTVLIDQFAQSFLAAEFR